MYRQNSTVDALRYLAERCDGARTEDGAGFNKMDSDFGRSLAERSTLTVRQEAAALKMLRKYRGQLERGGINMDELVQAFAHRENAEPRPPQGKRIDVGGEQFLITFPFDRRLLQFVKLLPDRRWNPESKQWSAPIDRCLEVEQFGKAHGFEFSQTARETIEEQRAVAEAQRRRVENVIEASQAHDADIEVPVEGLRPFQKAGVQYALDRRRTFIADEMGLGKTVQALTTLEADGAFPALIVCPKSVVPSWRKEIRQWLPERKMQVVHSRSRAGEADITVIHYDALASRVDVLMRGYRALVVDESHFTKNRKARRTQLVQAIADRLEGDDPIVLLLSGTPLVNRPGELIPQLRIMRRLEDLGGFKHYFRYYCGSDERGAQNLNELNVELRGTCMVRRLKSDVLTELPPRQFVNVDTGLSNQREYRFAEDQFLRWVAENGGDVFRASRAEALVRLTKLRGLAARGKLAEAVDWCKDFLESDGKLVVFAHQKEAQAALVRELADFNPRTIKAEDTVDQREANVRAFQEDERVRVIVCSLRAGGIGITLTASSNVAFLELDWTPAGMIQALDRCHRIGQRDAVTGWQLVAPDTIDDFMAALLAEKREIMGQTLDGTAAAEQDESLFRELVERMTRKRGA